MTATNNHEWQEHRLEDIEFYFRIKNYSKVSVDFEAYELYTYDNGEGEPLKFMYFDDNGSQHWTSDVSKAEPYVKGFIKWDGCSEVDFARNIHSCEGRWSLVRLGKLFEEIFTIAATMIDSNGEYL